MAQVNNSKNTPGFNGWLGVYSWYSLETSQGVYNTSLIDGDLAYLASLSQKYGKTFRLIIQPEFDVPSGFPRTCPSVPQIAPYSSAAATNLKSLMPDYIIKGVSGMGSDCYPLNGNEGITAAWWRPAVTARWNALIAYLGAKYDGNPNVEMIVPIQQTSDSVPTPLPSDYTEAAAIAAYESIISAAQAAFPTTNKTFNINFSGPPLSQGDLTMLAQYAVSHGTGLGGPDTAQPSDGTCPGVCGVGQGDGPTYGMAIMTGAGGVWGTTNYGGMIPTGWQEQADDYIHPLETAAGIEAYQYGTLTATHEIWADHGTNGTPPQTWAGVVSALQAVNFRINSACPKIYTAGCNTN